MTAVLPAAIFFALLRIFAIYFRIPRHTRFLYVLTSFVTFKLGVLAFDAYLYGMDLLSAAPW